MIIENEAAVSQQFILCERRFQFDFFHYSCRELKINLSPQMQISQVIDKCP